MVAGIEVFDNGQAAFVGARVGGWHQLGTVMPGLVTADEALRIAHLAGWEVEKLALFAKETIITPTGVETIEIPATARFMTARKHPITGRRQFLGDVGGRYTVFQNEETVDFLQELAGISGAVIDTAGSLFDGKRIFVSMKLPNDITVGGEDVTGLWLIGMNSHDGTSGFDICLSAIRPVCWNTVTAAFRGAKTRISIKHTKNAGQRLNEAREALSMSIDYAERFRVESEALLAQAFSDADFDNFLLNVFDEKALDDASVRKQNQMQEVRNLWSGSPTLLGTKDTKLGAFQAFTEYQTHFSGAHGKTTQLQAFNRTQRDLLDDATRTKAWNILATV